MGGVTSRLGRLVGGVISQTGTSVSLVHLLGEYLRGPTSCAVLRASASLQPRGRRVDEIKVKATLPLRRMEVSPGPWTNTSQLPSPGGHPVSQTVGPEGSPGSLTITRHTEASVTPRSQAPCRIEVRCVCFCVCLKNKRKSMGQIFIQLGAPLPLLPLPCHGYVIPIASHTDPFCNPKHVYLIRA